MWYWSDDLKPHGTPSPYIAWTEPQAVSSPVFVSLGANIGTPVNMLVDAVLHGDWPSIPQYCGTVLIAVSFIILVAWHGTKSYNTVLLIKAAYYHLHLMLCLLFTMKGRSWETKMAQKQEGLCCNVWLYSEGEMLRCQIAGGGLCRGVFCWNWIHLTMKPGRQGSPTWVWKHRSHFAEERIVEAKHLRFQGFLPRTWRGPPHHRPSEPIVDSDQQHLGSPQSASHQFSHKKCLQNLAAFPIGSSWCRLAPSCLWLFCCDHQSWKIQLKSPVLSSHGFHEKEG